MEAASHSDKLITILKNIHERLCNLPVLSLQEVEEGLARLRRNDYLVAVFGAFSAGKSSLLNALLGESLLVVSPNPTTASVTSLQGASTANEVEVVVTAKTEAELWRDVTNAFAALHEAPQSLADGIARAGKLNPREFPTSVRSHIRFLKSIHDGYSQMQERLGTTWVTTFDELKTFSAEEQYAAYVARVDVHAEHPWLRRGFIFVDTPGVDSIHRRHTDVAFRYMRHADAVIFVMYYTHAFTQGDRDFLLQLSGVQDVAETNKLFAVINAVDLAKSDDERAAVRQRVDQELRRLGIRFPRVYEVSAQLALAGRRLAQSPEDETGMAIARSRMNLDAAASLPTPEQLLNQSGILQLENDLEAYVHQEGDAIAFDMVKRTVTQLTAQIDQLIQAEQALRDADADAQSRRLAALRQIASDIQVDAKRDTDVHVSPLFVQLTRELNELVFYAGERIRFRYRDLFRAAFHPGRFRIGKAQDKLREAGEELCDALARQVDIETRTLSLRAAAIVEKTFQHTAEHWLSVLREHGVHNIGAPVSDFADIVVETVETDIPVAALRPYYRHFSSPRQFFEGGGQHEMMDASEEGAMAAVNIAMNDATAAVLTQANDGLQAALRTMYKSFGNRLDTATREAERPFDADKLEQLLGAQAFMRDIGLSTGE